MRLIYIGAQAHQHSASYLPCSLKHAISGSALAVSVRSAAKVCVEHGGTLLEHCTLLQRHGLTTHSKRNRVSVLLQADCRHAVQVTAGSALRYCGEPRSLSILGRRAIQRRPSLEASKCIDRRYTYPKWCLRRAVHDWRRATAQTWGRKLDRNLTSLEGSAASFFVLLASGRTGSACLSLTPCCMLHPSNPSQPGAKRSNTWHSILPP